MTTTLAEITELIHERFDVETSELDPDKPLTDYGLDSLTLIELIFELEDRFHITVPESRPDIQTLAALVAIIDELRKNGQASNPAEHL